MYKHFDLHLKRIYVQKHVENDVYTTFLKYTHMTCNEKNTSQVANINTLWLPNQGMRPLLT
jgi:hypothetical protein